LLLAISEAESLGVAFNASKFDARQDNCSQELFFWLATTILKPTSPTHGLVIDLDSSMDFKSIPKLGKRLLLVNASDKATLLREGEITLRE